MITALKTLYSAARVVRRIGNPRLTRREFFGTMAAGAGTAVVGCEKKVEKQPVEQTKDASQKVPEEIIELLKMSIDEPHFAAWRLAEIEGGSLYLSFMITDGSFSQFYFASQALAQSPLPEAGRTIQAMVGSSKRWEKVLGLILWGHRAATIDLPHKDPAKLARPFLLSPDPLIQLGAIISLMKMRAEHELVAFMFDHQDSVVAAKIGHLLSYRQHPLVCYWPHFETTDLDLPSPFRTCFFRYPHVLDELKKDLSAASLIWEPGCSTGLTTESIHIVTNARVIGTEINPLALLYADRGRYLMDGLSAMARARGFKTVEVAGLVAYGEERGWDVKKVFWDNFDMEKGVFGLIYPAKRGHGKLSFAFDDICSPVSPIKDTSVDAVVYTNVHYQLPEIGKKQAIQKIYNKLKSGGKLYLIDATDETYPQFEAVFGKPVKSISNLRVYVKR